jgi:SAM-dependent methyltransferase
MGRARYWREPVKPGVAGAQHLISEHYMQISCPVCEGACFPLDVVDFNKSCGANGEHLPLSLIPIYYFLCEHCGFCFAPEFSNWRLEDFESKIYNNEYVQVDPDYVEKRPLVNARNLLNLFGDQGKRFKHLDYGGGKGLLSEVLLKSEWQSTSYDPFVDRDRHLEDLGKFDLISAFEVFEHVPDVRRLVSDLSLLLVQDGIVIFSTLLSDGNLNPRQRLNWWYASPRNGHISLFSKKSLSMLGAKEGFHLLSFSPGVHAFWWQIPPWAAHIIREDPGSSAHP